MGLLKAERRRAGLGGRELEGPTRNVADPQRPHEFEAGQPSEVLGVPFRQPRVLGLLPDDGILHDGIAEVIDHRRDGEDASQPLVQTFLGMVCLACACVLIRRRQNSHWGGGQRQPCDRASSCDGVETACAIVTSSVMSGRCLLFRRGPVGPCCATELTTRERRYSLHHLIQIQRIEFRYGRIRTKSDVPMASPRDLRR